MPFKSAAQRRYLYAKHPQIARRWSAEEKAVNKSAPRFGTGGGGHGSRITESVEVSKSRREYDPEHRRQRRLGMGEAVLLGTGGGAAGYGGHGAYRTKQAAGKVTGVTGKDAKAVKATRDALKSGLLIRPRHLGALAGGAAALGGAGLLRGHAEKPKGRPWD